MDSGLTMKPVLFTFTVTLTPNTCYKNLILPFIQSTTWTKTYNDFMAGTLLDQCTSYATPQPLKLFQWTPTTSDLTYMIFGNNQNGNPAVDWTSTNKV